MDQITLHIWVIADNEKLTDELRKCRPVQGVTYDFQTVSSAWNIGHIEGTFDHLIITDRLDHLMPFFNQRGTSLIFIGTSTDLCKWTRVPPNNLLEIWDPDAPLIYRSSRLYHAATNHITIYHEWLYRNYLMATIDSMQDLVWYKDKEGLHWLVNNKFEDTVKKTRAQVYGMGHNFIWDVPPEEGHTAEYKCMESEREVMRRKETVVADEMVQNAKGLRHFLTYKSPLYGRDGQVMGTVGIGHDVTDMNNASLELQILIDHLPLAVAVCNEHWKPAQVNSRFSELFGIHIDPEDEETFDYLDWKKQTLHPIDERVYDDKLHSYQQEITVEQNGAERSFSVTEQEILDYFGNVTGYYCLYRDTTEAREYERMILHTANTDPLTSLYNRRYFFEFMEAHRNEPMTVLFMDMDNFKQVNDVHGHAAGDEVLTGTANEIRRLFPKGTVARLGGDEFAVVLTGTVRQDDLQSTIDMLTRNIEKVFAHLKVGLSVSVGVAHTDGNVENIDDFLEESDRRMYEQKQAKKVGR
ncbi:MAG: diguanylate cyclase [Lachnospiraceae bacterium]|nr:diguanylate cyclase [Lachnospiraceae bacterium]